MIPYGCGPKLLVALLTIMCVDKKRGGQKMQAESEETRKSIDFER